MKAMESVPNRDFSLLRLNARSFESKDFLPFYIISVIVEVCKVGSTFESNQRPMILILGC